MSIPLPPGSVKVAGIAVIRIEGNAFRLGEISGA